MTKHDDNATRTLRCARRLRAGRRASEMGRWRAGERCQRRHLELPALAGILRYERSLLTYCFGGGCVSFEPLAGQLPVPRPMAWTSMEALPGLSASFTSPWTCTDSATCDASLDLSA